jgi:hypothetical protein
MTTVLGTGMSDAIDRLGTMIAGRVLRPGEDGFDEAIRMESGVVGARPRSRGARHRSGLGCRR